MTYVVQRADGAVARKSFDGNRDNWDHIPSPSEYVLTWETREGADKYARMNGGEVKRFEEVF